MRVHGFRALASFPGVLAKRGSCKLDFESVGSQRIHAMIFFTYGEGWIANLCDTRTISHSECDLDVVKK